MSHLPENHSPALHLPELHSQPASARNTQPYAVSRRTLLASIPGAAAATLALAAQQPEAVAQAADNNAAEFRLDSPPVLQTPTPDSMGVAWAVNGLSSSWVEYGPSAAELNQKAIASHLGLLAVDPRFHQARITGLTPGETVFYRVVGVPIRYESAYKIHRGQPVASQVYRFTTPTQNCETAKVCVINDTHERTPTLKAVLANVAQQSPDYLVWNGDVFNDIRSTDQIVAQVLRPADQAYATQTPVLFCSGNHDVRGVAAREISQAFLPWPNEPVAGRSFVVRQGPLALIGLDTGEDKPDHVSVFAGLADFEGYLKAQQAWLAAALQRPEVASAPYLVVCCHIPLHGLPGHNGGDTEQGYAYYSKLGGDLWGPLLHQAQAQVVISGHMHQFRYDAPVEGRGWGQLVGGGPDLDRATVMHLEAAEKLTIQVTKADGSVIERFEFAPRTLS